MAATKLSKGTSDLDVAVGQRYYVYFDGTKIGWVTKSERTGRWSGNALVGPSAHKAPSVIENAPRRKDAVDEVLIAVHRNLGRVTAWSVEESDHPVWIDNAALRTELGLDF